MNLTAPRPNGLGGPTMWTSPSPSRPPNQMPNSGAWTWVLVLSSLPLFAAVGVLVFARCCALRRTARRRRLAGGAFAVQDGTHPRVFLTNPGLPVSHQATPLPQWVVLSFPTYTFQSVPRTKSSSTFPTPKMPDLSQLSFKGRPKTPRAAINTPRAPINAPREAGPPGDIPLAQLVIEISNDDVVNSHVRNVSSDGVAGIGNAGHGGEAGNVVSISNAGDVSNVGINVGGNAGSNAGSNMSSISNVGVAGNGEGKRDSQGVPPNEKSAGIDLSKEKQLRAGSDLALKDTKDRDDARISSDSELIPSGSDELLETGVTGSLSPHTLKGGANASLLSLAPEAANGALLSLSPQSSLQSSLANPRPPRPQFSKPPPLTLPDPPSPRSDSASPSSVQLPSLLAPDGGIINPGSTAAGSATDGSTNEGSTNAASTGAGSTNAGNQDDAQSDSTNEGSTTTGAANTGSTAPAAANQGSATPGATNPGSTTPGVTPRSTNPTNWIAPIHRLSRKTMNWWPSFGRSSAATGGDNMDDEQACMICLDDYMDGEVLMQLPCGHTFHRECIASWLNTHDTCPACRICLLPPGAGQGAV